MEIQARLLCVRRRIGLLIRVCQRFMAKRMGATTIEVKASHLSLISHPDTGFAKLILEAAGRA